MFDYAELEEHAKSLNWYNLCLGIQEASKTHTKECFKALNTLVIPNALKIHPQTLQDTIMPLAQILEPQASLDLARKGIEILMQRHNSKVQKLFHAYKTKEHECLLYLKQQADTESFVYATIHASKKNPQKDHESEKSDVNKKLSKNAEKLPESSSSVATQNLENMQTSPSQNPLNADALNPIYTVSESLKDYASYKFDDDSLQNNPYFLRLCYRYFEGISIYDKCHQYLMQYIDNKPLQDSFSDNDELLAYKITKYTLLNRKCMNLDAIFNHSLFAHLKDANLRSLFESVKNGNIPLINNNQLNIEGIFGNAGYALIEEKAFLIAINDLCYQYRNKELRISDMTVSLKISRTTALNFLVRGMGLNLISGKIDGKNDIVNIKMVQPKQLNKDEIIELAKEILSWRNKVKEVIECMS